MSSIGPIPLQLYGNTTTQSIVPVQSQSSTVMINIVSNGQQPTVTDSSTGVTENVWPAYFIEWCDITTGNILWDVQVQTGVNPTSNGIAMFYNTNPNTSTEVTPLTTSTNDYMSITTAVDTQSLWVSFQENGVTIGAGDTVGSIPLLSFPYTTGFIPNFNTQGIAISQSINGASEEATPTMTFNNAPSVTLGSTGTPNKPSSPSDKTKWIIIGGTVVGGIILLLILLIGYKMYRKRQLKSKEQQK